MTYVDDDDFDEFDADDKEMDDDLEKDEVGRCDECGLKIKKDDAIVCPACTATYHKWCVTECNRCNTPLSTGDSEDGKPVKAAAKKATPGRAAPKKKAAVKAAPTVRSPRAR